MGKKNKNNPADPEGTIMMHIYNLNRSQLRRQLLKRKNIIDRRVMYTDVNNERVMGVVVGFDEKFGEPQIFQEDSKQPHENPNVMIIE